MVRAMSAQKRDLSRRLKASESSNRQLRAELRELGAGLHNGRPVSSQLPSTVGTPCSAVRGERTGCSSLQTGCKHSDPGSNTASAQARHHLLHILRAVLPAWSWPQRHCEIATSCAYVLSTKQTESIAPISIMQGKLMTIRQKHP